MMVVSFLISKTCSHLHPENFGKNFQFDLLAPYFFVKDGSWLGVSKNSLNHQPNHPTNSTTGSQDLQEFQEIFNLVDTDRGGSIGTEELARSVMPSPKWVQQLPVNFCYERKKRLYLPLVHLFEAMKLQSQVVFCVFFCWLIHFQKCLDSWGLPTLFLLRPHFYLWQSGWWTPWASVTWLHSSASSKIWEILCEWFDLFWGIPMDT